MVMTPDRLRELLAAYGADPSRWPEEERAAALDLVRRTRPSDALTREAVLDHALDAWKEPSLPKLDPLRVTAKITALPQRAPRRTGAFVAVTWSKIGGLAAAAAVSGFLVGWSGIGEELLPGPAAAASSDAVAIVAVMEDAAW